MKHYRANGNVVIETPDKPPTTSVTLISAFGTPLRAESRPSNLHDERISLQWDGWNLLTSHDAFRVWADAVLTTLK